MHNSGAITHDTEMVPRQTTWGPHNLTLTTAGRVHRPPREDEKFVQEELPYFATLCNSARLGKFEFFSSFEILMEASRQKGRSEGYLGIDLLRGVPIKHVPSPIQRSIVIGTTESIGMTREEQMEFFRSIEHPRFLEIKQAVGEAHIGDVYHLWTAEVASLDVFLTVDKRFRNAVDSQKARINSPVWTMTPRELCEYLGLQPTDIEKLAAGINPLRLRGSRYIRNRARHLCGSVSNGCVRERQEIAKRWAGPPILNP